MSMVDLDTQPPGYGQVKPGQVHQLPGTSASRQLTGLPGISATKVPGLPGTSAMQLDDGVLHAQAIPQQQAPGVNPATSDLRRLNLTEKAAVVLGVDPSTVARVGTVGSVVLVSGAGLLWALSYLFPQMRLALTQGGLKGGLKGVPLVTTPRPVDG
jgi:hypothetical protein